MEIILSVVVICAIFAFGALISVGNERQRRAIDELREQVVLWAIQDLRIKRDALAREVRVEDPLAWLNKMVAIVTGHGLDLEVAESFNEPQALVCKSEAQNTRIIFSPLSPVEVQRLKREQRSRLSKFTDQNPLLSLSGKIKFRELNTLNVGFLFDLEFPLAWKSITGLNPRSNSLWMYLVG
ncbi:MAG: hypothetical protein ACOYZ8_06685 [Chloroflexota bacterium]